MHSTRIPVIDSERHLGAFCGEMAKISGYRTRCDWWRTGQVAEAERNRTSQAEILDFNGFEDRAAHQDGYASSNSPVMIPTPVIAPESVPELQIYLG
jgi:hypothetical protein